MRLECWCQDSAVSVVMSCQRYEAGHSISHITHPPFQIRARDQRAREALPSLRFLGRAPWGRQCQRRRKKARPKTVSSVAGWASTVIRPLDVFSWIGCGGGGAFWGTAIRQSKAEAVNFVGPREPHPRLSRVQGPDNIKILWNTEKCLLIVLLFFFSSKVKLLSQL